MRLRQTARKLTPRARGAYIFSAAPIYYTATGLVDAFAARCRAPSSYSEEPGRD